MTPERLTPELDKPLRQGPFLVNGDKISTPIGLASVTLDKERLRQQILGLALERGGKELVQSLTWTLGRLSLNFADPIKQLVLADFKRQTLNPLAKAILFGLIPLIYAQAEAIYFHDEEEPMIAVDLPCILRRFSTNFSWPGVNPRSILLEQRTEFNQCLAETWVHEREHLVLAHLQPDLSLKEGERRVREAEKKATLSDIDFLRIKLNGLSLID